MIFKQQEASGELKHLIEKYTLIQSEEDDQPLFRDRFIPNGYAGLVFNFQIHHARYSDLPGENLPESFIVLPKLNSTLIEIGLPIESLIVLFKTAVLTRSLGLSLDQSSSRPHIGADIFGGYPMYDKLKEFDRMEDRIAFFESYLKKHYPVAGYVPDEIDKIYHEIMSLAWKLPIQSIVSEHKISSRTFRRNFVRRTGISAKSLARIVRVNYLWQKISSGEFTDFQTSVYFGNFHDQSHFIRDFKMIVGETPRAFFSRNLEQVRIISGTDP
ncbi:MAG: AraC family transcriptional regulator [Bacteroidales bacterium]|nr:AraC family transcriptional regulator [Bacteroidales bacterium]